MTDQDDLPAAARVLALDAAGAVLGETRSGADGSFELWIPETAVATLTAAFQEDGPQARFDAIPAGSRGVRLRIPGRP